MSQGLFAKFITMSIILAPTLSQAAKLSTLRGYFLRVDTQNETLTTRTVDFQVGTCAKQKSIKSAKVEIGGKELPVTMDKSCLSWMDSISHQYFIGEHFLERTYSISIDGKTEIHTLFINPWDNKFTFAFDVRELSPSLTQKLSNHRNPIDTLLVGEVRTLETKSVGTINIMSTRIRVDNKHVSGILNGRNKVEHARNGRYALEYSLIDLKGKVLAKELRLIDVADGSADIDLILPADAQVSSIQFQVQPLESFQSDWSKLTNPKSEVRSFPIMN